MVRKEKKKLRIALLIESFSQPGWIHRIITDIEDSYFADIVLIIEKKSHDNDVAKRLPGLSINGHSVLWNLYARIDNRVSCPYKNPFEQFDISHLKERGCTVLSVQPIPVNGGNHLRKEDIQKILLEEVDLVLDFWRNRVTGAAVRIAKYGVWSGSPSHNSIPYGSPPGFWEVMRKESTIEFTLRMASYGAGRDKVLYQSWTATDPLSARGTISKVYWKSANSMVRKIRNLYERGPAALDDENLGAAADLHNGKQFSHPTNTQILGCMAKISGRRIQRSLWNRLHLEQWFLAYNLGKSGPSIDPPYDLQYMKPPKDRFWADPFPVARGGKYYIFMEEFFYHTHKAHISVIEMGFDGTWKQPLKVLERDYHLSYPFLFEWRNDLYMIPETKRNNTVELYRCTEFPLKWEFDRVLIANAQAVDNTLHEQDGIWWLFCSIGGKDFATNDELHVFYAETPLGPWRPHRLNPVKSDVRSARPAGRLFRVNGDLYRPSQDCSIRMGGAIVMNQVTRLNPEEFHEEVAARIEPKWAKGIYGTHTINTADRLTMLDCFGYVRKYLS